MEKHNFRELKIWKESMNLTENVYKFTKSIHSDEKFGLISQINRSALSIPSNIAEGSGRTTGKEFNRFLDIALASSYELETQLILASRIFDLETEFIISQLNEIQKMISGFKRRLI